MLCTTERTIIEAGRRTGCSEMCLFHLLHDVQFMTMDRIIPTQPPSSRPSTVVPSVDSAAGLETQSTSPSAPSTNVALKRKKRRKLKSALVSPFDGGSDPRIQQPSHPM